MISRNTANPQILSTIKTNYYDFGVTVAGTIAYVAGEFVLSAVDVSNPLRPRVLGSLEADYQYFDLVTEGRYAYAACGRGLEVIDISNPEQLLRLSDIYTGGWTIAIKGTYAYMTDLAGVVAADISDPVAPRVVGNVPFDDLHFDVNGLALSGEHVYVADCEFGLVVVDVSQIETAERPLYRSIGDLVFNYYIACLVVPGGIALYDFRDPLYPEFLGDGHDGRYGLRSRRPRHMGLSRRRRGRPRDLRHLGCEESAQRRGRRHAGARSRGRRLRILCLRCRLQ